MNCGCARRRRKVARVVTVCVKVCQQIRAKVGKKKGSG